MSSILSYFGGFMARQSSSLTVTVFAEGGKVNLCSVLTDETNYGFEIWRWGCLPHPPGSWRWLGCPLCSGWHLWCTTPWHWAQNRPFWHQRAGSEPPHVPFLVYEGRRLRAQTGPSQHRCSCRDLSVQQVILNFWHFEHVGQEIWLVFLPTYQVFTAPSWLGSEMLLHRTIDSVNRSVDGSTEPVWTSRLLLSRPTGWLRPMGTLQIGNVTFFQMSPKSHYQSHLHLSAQGQDCPSGNGETSVAAGDDPPALFLHAYPLVAGGFVFKRFPVVHLRLLSQLYKAGRRVMSACALGWDGTLMQHVFKGKNSTSPWGVLTFVFILDQRTLQAHSPPRLLARISWIPLQTGASSVSLNCTLK